MRTIVVALPEGVAERVAQIARAEFRTPKAQAAVLLIEALSRHGTAAELQSGADAARARERER